MEKFFGYCESLAVYDTYQFPDYSKYVVTRFDENEKARVRDEQFPLDCQKAYDLGTRLIQKSALSTSNNKTTCKVNDI